MFMWSLEIGTSGEDSVTVSDALRTLNTDIMAGKGPDILILDGMPVENYIQKGHSGGYNGYGGVSRTGRRIV